MALSIRACHVVRGESRLLIIVCRRVLISYLIHCRSISISCHVNFVNMCADKETTSDNLQSVAQNQALEPKRKASSVVWNYFGFTSDDVEQRVILCKLCRTTVSAPSSNTTNLYNHLKFNHRVQYEECLSVKKKSTKWCKNCYTDTHHNIVVFCFSVPGRFPKADWDNWSDHAFHCKRHGAD